MTKPSFNTTWIQAVKPENFDNADHDLEYKRKSQNVPLTKTHITNTCTAPFNQLTLDNKGRVFNCRCSGHVPFPVGYSNEFESFDDIFNSPMSLTHRDSVVNKQFTYCASQYCGIEGGDINLKPGGIYIALEMDFSCNLTCPSCRERMIFINDPVMIDKFNAMADDLCRWVGSTDKKVFIEFCGGDPYASIFYATLIERLVEYENTILITRTNGLLLLKNSSVIEKHLRQISLSISIDAASKEVYELVRRGGRWSNLIDNLDYAKHLMDTNPNFKVSSSFVVQKENLDDMIPFLEFTKNYNMPPIYAILEDWGVWNGNYEEQCVHLPSSPLYEKFVKIVNDPVFDQYNVNVDKFKAWCGKT